MEQQKMPIILQGESVFSELSIDAQVRDYKGSRAGQKYHIGTYQGIGFTVPAEVYDLWEAGEIAKITLIDAGGYIRKVPDPMNPGKEIEEPRNSWNLQGYVTWEQLNKVEENTVKRDFIKRKAELEFRVMEKKLLTVEQAETVLTAADITKLENEL